MKLFSSTVETCCMLQLARRSSKKCFQKDVCGGCHKLIKFVSKVRIFFEFFSSASRQNAEPFMAVNSETLLILNSFSFFSSFYPLINISFSASEYLFLDFCCLETLKRLVSFTSRSKEKYRCFCCFIVMYLIIMRYTAKV